MSWYCEYCGMQNTGEVCCACGKESRQNQNEPYTNAPATADAEPVPVATPQGATAPQQEADTRGIRQKLIRILRHTAWVLLVVGVCICGLYLAQDPECSARIKDNLSRYTEQKAQITYILELDGPAGELVGIQYLGKNWRGFLSMAIENFNQTLHEEVLRIWFTP